MNVFLEHNTEAFRIESTESYALHPKSGCAPRQSIQALLIVWYFMRQLALCITTTREEI